MQKSLVLAAAAGACFIAAAARAQTPSNQYALPHYGRLLDNNDLPASGVKEITFRIYDAAIGGTKVWEGKYSVPVSNQGVYSVVLGDSERPFDTAKVLGGPRWLGIQVDATTELSPRQEFGSALFALHALEAKNVKGGVVEGVQIRNSTLEAPTITGGTISNTTIDAVTMTNVNAQITSGSLKGVAVEATTLKAASIELDGQPVGANSVAKSGDTMTGELVAPKFVSNATNGAPLQVASRELVANLNAELVGGKKLEDLVLKSELRTGGNLAHNGGFESFARGNDKAPNWFASQAAFNASNSGISRVNGISGFALQLKDRDDAGRVIVKQVIVPTATAAMAGRRYTAGVSFRGDFTPAKGELCLSDAGNDNAETSKTCVTLTGSAQWQRAQVVHTLGAEPKFVKVTLAATLAANEAADYQFDELAVIEGEANPAFASHPEDGFTGMISAFAGACPAGWNEYTAGRGKFLRGEPTGNPASLDAGGSDDEIVVAHTHGVSGTVSTQAAHKHGVNLTSNTTGGHTHEMRTRNDDFNCTGDGAGRWGVARCMDNGDYRWGDDMLGTISAGNHAHTVVGDTADAGGHSHTFDVTSASAGVAGAGKNMPAYQEMIFCLKE